MRTVSISAEIVASRRVSPSRSRSIVAVRGDSLTSNTWITEANRRRGYVMNGRPEPCILLGAPGIAPSGTVSSPLQASVP
jgi:hypothetical protein